MKVLFIAPYVTINAIPMLTRCKCGFGYIVFEMAKGVSEKAEVDFVLRNYRYKAFNVDRVHFINNRFIDFLKNIRYCSSIKILFHLWKTYRMSYKELIVLIYVWLQSGYYYKSIKDGNYDIVHIHGCGFFDEIYIDICRRCAIKFVITLHGLNSFSNAINVERSVKEYERDILRKVVKKEFPLTVISSGIKNTICNEYGIGNSDYISVVCNSFSFNENVDDIHCDLDIKIKYNLPQDCKVLLYVGNISRNKNQEQLIRAFDLMPNELCTKTYVLFCGRDIEGGYAIDGMIEQSRYKDHLILCGNVDKEIMPSYFSQADAIVLLSKAEGFGLSLIEGMHFGLPCMTFADLDAYEDIYDECAVVGLKSRSDQEVADGVQRLLETKWDKDKIIQHSKKFERQSMIEKYIEVYKKIIYGR